MEENLYQVIVNIDAIEAYCDALDCFLNDAHTLQNLLPSAFTLTVVQHEKIASLTTAYEALSLLDDATTLSFLLKIANLNVAINAILNQYAEDKSDIHINSLRSINADILSFLNEFRECVG
ncbi:hypothetical protein F3I27_21805 [Pantoea sp. Bo_2]|uniref:Uncharacterized protein n=1 Tax=Candidatus Pantoea gossypiicola TaxID=2608008 RepID=A0AB34CEV4_9GAMM|nr:MULTISPECIES: hypothetical protein [Pantoea]KAA5937574.1 hypothetical protein F3I57_21280 [Pantoea sp. VH_3]KAA5946705.1 hypothetical protein F3I56_22065 [Pantoea sp. VH_25]KAA5949525.1 hypothetical protein F3I55_22420 [Pantoea sp. VH_24]KAA5957728.1 hypothetical protein F3I53_15875 [Pantoea sp. VH_16]KAA5959139.1 hypothetical protein F3I54_22450 [Pantoea sp. VH_18]